jgi:hypothetical protein
MLIAFSGLKGSGKDTAANYLAEKYHFRKIAFADALRQMLLIIDPEVTFEDMWGFNCRRLSQIVSEEGWDEAKWRYPEVRRLMQVTGTEAVRMLFGEDSWVNILDKRFPDLADNDTRYVITDCRFDNEVEFVRNQGGVIVWIDRPGTASDGHSSESDHLRDLASTIVHNGRTIDDLYDALDILMRMRGIDEQRGDTR